MGSQDSSPGHEDWSKVPARLTSWGDAGESWAELGVPSQRGGCNQPPLCEEALFGAWWLGQGELGTGASGGAGLAMPWELGEHQGQAVVGS